MYSLDRKVQNPYPIGTMKEKGDLIQVNITQKCCQLSLKQSALMEIALVSQMSNYILS